MNGKINWQEILREVLLGASLGAISVAIFFAIYNIIEYFTGPVLTEISAYLYGGALGIWSIYLTFNMRNLPKAATVLATIAAIYGYDALAQIWPALLVGPLNMVHFMIAFAVGILLYIIYVSYQQTKEQFKENPS